MIDLLLALVCWVLLLGGCALVVSGGIGLVRLPDFYSRLHAASVTDTGGVILICGALFLQAIFTFGSIMVAIKVVLIMFFTLFTAPTASHALAKTALLTGRVPLGADGKPILDSPETAARMARSRPVGEHDPQFAPATDDDSSGAASQDSADTAGER